VLNCEYAIIGEYPGSAHVSDANVVRMILARHHAEEGCAWDPGELAP
jgi:hypothetical protein